MFLFLKVSIFQEGFFIVTNLILLVVENTYLILLLWFNFGFLMLGSSNGSDTHVILPCFFSICAIGHLIICFDLRFRIMFRKITISLLYHTISVFKILLQIFLLFNFLLVLRNLISVKVCMISCCQTLV